MNFVDSKTIKTFLKIAEEIAPGFDEELNILHTPLDLSVNLPLKHPEALKRHYKNVQLYRTVYINVLLHTLLCG